jgi:hypothetical protein
MEHPEFDILFSWFVGLGIDHAVWDHSTFSKNRDRLLDGEVAARLLLAQPRVKRLLSNEHFSVDGTPIEACASMKSFKPRDGQGGPDNQAPPTTGGRNCEADFKRQKRSNETHVSTTDPDAMLYRRAPAWKPGSPSSATR